MKRPFVVYADTESLLETIDICDNNPENLSITKVSKHAACGCPLLSCLFESNKNKHDY